MGNHKKCGKRRLLSGMLAGIMAVSTFLSSGPVITVEAKETSDTEQTSEMEQAIVDISYEGLSDDGDLAVIFSASDSSWETVYEVQDGVTSIDGKETDTTQISVPKDENVFVLVVADDYHKMTGLTVLNENGVDLLVPQIKENVRNCWFKLSELPDTFSIHAVVEKTEEAMGQDLPSITSTEENNVVSALASEQQQALGISLMDASLDYMPSVGQEISGEGTIQFDGVPGTSGTFHGSFTSGDLAGATYAGWMCGIHGAANPGESGEVTADYVATCTATGTGWATFDVILYTQEGPISDGTPHSGYQTVLGEITVAAKNPMGTVILQKVSANPEYTNNNPAYDLTGAKYGIYTDKACTNLVDTLTVQSNDGKTNESIELEEGTYYAKELQGTATGYTINSNVMAFTVTADVTQKLITLSGNMVEPTLTDPIPLLVQKAVSDWNTAGKLEGDVTTLSGIQFRVDYYTDIYSSVSEAVSSGTVAATAVFETDEDGFLFFSDATPVSGTWPYKDSMGYNTIPLGTVVITEVSSLDGLQVAGYAQAFTLTADGDTVAPNVLSGWPTQSTDEDAIGAYENTIWKGGVTVYKADADEHAQNAQGDGNFGGVQYEIVNNSENSVYVNGKEVAVGDVVMTIQTIQADDGIWATTGENVLPYGTYTIREISGNSSYNQADWSETFSIRSDGQMVTFGTTENWNEDPVKRGSIQITKADEDTGLSVPEGDAELANTSYDIYNQSKSKVYVNGAWFDTGDKIATIQTVWDEDEQAYIAEISGLPYGTYKIVEAGAPVGYHKADYSKTVQIREDGQVVKLEDAASNYNVDSVFRGGVSVTKADADWNTSEPQGDATLEGTVYQIINRSQNAVFMWESMTSYEPGEVVMTLTTEWNEATQSYMASTGTSSLPYGTYEIVEVEASTGYVTAEWSQTFTIRQEGEMHYFDSTESNVTGPNSDYEFHHEWNENEVMRGGIIVGKVDRETGQYISLGEADLSGSVFEIINQSEHPVYVNGETYDVGDVIMTITTQEMEWNGETIYAATTGNYILPYGTYEVREISSGTGYLYDSTSEAYTKTVQIREDGQMVDLTEETDAVANQVLREDWHFQKKAEDSMERMDQIAFLVTSMTTGEQHVIVTDENGTWGSSWVDHSDNTNANDPDSPNSNGAIAVDEDGNWYVADSSKLDCDAGVWFTGMANDAVTWNEDGTSYDVNGTTVTVNDDLRAFPYDTYIVQELRCENNEGYKLVNFTVTLHRYTSDHDGEGLDIDYGTIDDARIALGTTLTYGLSDKIAPATEDLVLRDTVTYNNLDVDATYVMKGELHIVNDDGSDGGVIATAEKEFNSGTGVGKMTMEFNLDASDLTGKSVVAFEYLTQDGALIAEHEDITDENQTVKFPEIGTTLTGDLGHVSNANAKTITLTDKISYKYLEVGKEYTITGTLMDQETGKALTDTDGNPITATKTFVPVSEEGTTNVVFTFSDVDVAGKTVVAFESVSKDDVTYTVHEDIEDEAQSVSFPVVDSYAVDGTDYNKDLAASAETIITDALRVTNLDDSYSYQLIGELHIRNANGEDEGALTDADGNTVTSTLTWTGAKTDLTMTFENVDTSELSGKDLVIFQTLYGTADDPEDEDASWVVLGTHADITDDDQSVNVPKIGTTLLTDQELHEAQVSEDGMITLTDTIAYENVTPGHDYAVVGTLYTQETDEDGNLIAGEAVATATATFTAEETDGTVPVEFTFDATGLDGKSVVAYEVLYSSPASDVAEDWVDLLSVSESSFTTEELDDAWIVATHESVTDEDQTIHFADIGTTLTANTGLHETQVSKDDDKTVTLTDTIAYENLIPGHTYTVNGTLHIQETDEEGNVTDGGTVQDAEGNAITASTTFIPVEANGEVEVIFTFDASGLEGQTVVAFEDISTNDIVFATHADITDEAQAVHFVEIETTALAENGLHEMQVPSGDDGTITITDNVAYENVIPGTEYTITGTLHLQSVDDDGNITDAGTIKDAEGNEVTTSVTFTAETANGTVPIEFTFDASGLEGKTVVAFETLTCEDALVATHADITDADQSIHFVDLGTTALAENGLHETQIPDEDDKTVTLTDVVAYENVIPGHTYTLSGTLHIQDVDENGNIIDGGTVQSEDGTDLISIATFTPVTESGTTEVTFTFDASELDGKTVVAFETLSMDNITVATHADITDEAQSVNFATLHTTALAENGTHMTQVPSVDGETVTITDTVAYTNLIPGATYKVSGTLHIQDTDEDGNIVDGGTVQGTNLVLVDETSEESADEDSSLVEETSEESADEDSSLVEETSDLIAETVFTAEEATGTVDVTFIFDASELDGKTVVAFETLTRDDKVIATHADITDEDQSVNFVRVRTRALAENGEHEMTLSDSDQTVTITDLVEYKNLIPGLEYTVSGTLHVRNTNNAGIITDGGVLTVDGNEVTAEATFTADETDGSVEVEFTFDASELGDATVVAFEELSYEGAVIATHADITDDYQAVTFHSPVVEDEDTSDILEEIIKTGQAMFFDILILLGIALIAGGGYIYIRKKSR